MLKERHYARRNVASVELGFFYREDFWDCHP
jgi:hypothetical protein